MTTRTFTSVGDYTTDAGFRAMGSEINTNFIAAGLVQTADTGQINWTTATRAGGGYEIYRFSDALQSTAPIFMKITYQTNSPDGGLAMILSVGEGSNGSGTLTGTVTGTLSSGNGFSGGYHISSSSTPYTSYVCHTAGFFGFQWKAGGWTARNTGSTIGIMISRTCDSSGAFTTAGYQIITSGTGSGPYRETSVKTTSPANVSTSTDRYAIVPGLVASSLDSSGNIQVYPYFMHCTDIKPSITLCAYVVADISQFTTFTTTLFGSTSHTYIAIQPSTQGNGMGTGDSTGTTSYGIGMLWE